MVLLLLGAHIEEKKVVVVDEGDGFVHGDAVFAGHEKFDVHLPKDVGKGGRRKEGIGCVHGHLVGVGGQYGFGA